MERGHEFTINLPGDGTYVVKLLEGVEIDEVGGVTSGLWSAFDLHAQGDSEDEVYQELLGELQQRFAGGPGSPEFEHVRAYIHEHGSRLSDEEVAALDLAKVRGNMVRWRITDDEQYMVRLWQNSELHREGDTVTVRAFELEGSGEHLGQAVQALTAAVSDATGEHDAPGPRFDEFTSWVRANGERVSAEVLAEEAEQQAEYIAARDKLPAITPDDIDAQSSTGIPLLVDFWAAWCGPCRQVTPVLADLAQQWAGRIAIRKIDVDQFDGIWERFDFRGIPAMLMFKDGKEIHRVIGFGGKQSLVAELEPHLASVDGDD
ncbi:thioredoxin family protein [Nocardia sp. NPDC058666]|uniref:thioredoxin family protein n=1 Tax=Nocardia sp. NPDC058666 TaxID=3346587 RepID=UPI003654C7AA